MTETELKFTIDKRTAARLRTRLSQLASAQEPSTVRSLHSVYFDTPGHRLKKAGVALRIRRDGDQWIQTVKAKTKNHTGLQIADEAETVVPDARIHLKRIPDKRLRKSVSALLKGRELVEICETDMKRTATVLHGPDGTEVEVAVDDGQIIAGTQARPFRELELELKSGTLSSLYALAADLLPCGGLEMSRLSKSERGYLLAATGSIVTDQSPRHALPVSLDASMTTAQAARRILRECSAQVLVNLRVVRLMTDPEGPHQLRIGLRRLRSAMDLFAPELDSPRFSKLKKEAATLAKLVGTQRDLDVAINDLLTPAIREFGASDGLMSLRDNLVARAAANRDGLRDILESTRTQGFALDLACYIEAQDWPSKGKTGKALMKPIRKRMRTALDQSWKKVECRARHIRTQDHEARHELRKALKRFRYQLEFATPLFSAKKTAVFVKRLKRLQTKFGHLNDLATLQALFQGPITLATVDPNARAALDDLMVKRADLAEQEWASAQRHWSALVKTQPVW